MNVFKKVWRMAEFFEGSGVMKETFRGKGFKVQGYEMNEKLHKNENTRICNILDVTTLTLKIDLGYPVDVIWASPPCTSFSVASLGHHWQESKCGHPDIPKKYWNINGHYPKTEKCLILLGVLEHTWNLIEDLLKENPKMYFFVENPSCMTHNINFMQKYKSYMNVITYCQYGERYQKKTIIWTNAPVKFKPPCKPRSNCHESAPAGSKTGVQGLNGNYERAKLPQELCEFIASECLRLLENGSPHNPTLFDF